MEKTPEIQLDDITIRRLLNLSATGLSEEIDLIHLPGAITDHEPSYFGLVLAGVNEKQFAHQYGPLTIVEEQYSCCDNCGEKISMPKQQYSKIAIESSKWESAKTIISYLCSLGHTCSGMERVLGLPQRTFSQWRSSHEPAAAGLALLRFIRTYPWLLDVAAEGFSASAAKRSLFSAAMQEIGESLSAEANCVSFEQSGAAVVEGNDGDSQAVFVSVFSGEKQQTLTDGNLQLIEL
jgi:hypothetical protein